MQTISDFLCTSGFAFDRLHLNNKNKNVLFYFVLSSIWITFSRSRMQIYLYSLRLIEILHYLCKR